MPVWLLPHQQRTGDIVLVDSTDFAELFGGTASLGSSWRDLALMQ